ncbi:MAG: aspartate aminotransferase family protein [Acidimicrobiia bacterium]
MGRHRELLARHRGVLPSWLTLYYDEPIEIVRGEGRRVFDGEGNRYLDFFGGILTTMVGHGVPEVVEAIREQAGKVLHTSTLYLSDPMVELAELIVARSGIPDARVFFTNSGTEANDAALLLASTYRRSNQILAMRNSYHGRSFATMGVTGNRAWSASSLSPFAVSYLHSGYRFRSPFRALDDDAFNQVCADDMHDVILTCTAGDVAALITEPIQGVGGFAVPPDGFFQGLEKVADEHGILFISDEVQTGWGRTGEHYWGYEAHDVTPDIITFAKGVGNGLAIAGVIARAEIMNCVTANSISTFGGNPLACAGALATLRYAHEHDLQGNAKRMGDRLMGRLKPLEAECGGVGEVRGKGLMIGIELVGDDGFTPAPQLAAAVLDGTRREGVLIGKGGLFGNCLRVAPPLSVTEDEADEAVEVIERVIRNHAS